MFFRHSADKLILPLLVGTILIIISYRPPYHLCPDMLRGFFLATAPCGPTCLLEQRIAHAYWDSALMNIQWKYPRGHSLPVAVPPEFGIDAPALALRHLPRLGENSIGTACNRSGTCPRRGSDVMSGTGAGPVIC